MRRRVKTTTLSDRSGQVDHRVGVSEGSLGQIFRRAILWLPHVRRLRAIIRFDDNSSSATARPTWGREEEEEEEGRKGEGGNAEETDGTDQDQGAISYDRTQLHAESLMERFEPEISRMPWKAIAT